ESEAAAGVLFGMTESLVSVLGPSSSPFDLQPPSYDSLKRLYCRNGGNFLRVLPGGAVEGTVQERDPYTVLKVKAVSPGVVVIRGQEAGRYLAMDRSGKLYGSALLNDECYFTEKMEENHYNTYSSHTHQEHGVWYVGIKKNGQMKRGPNTHTGQNAVFFLPL
ncbi:fibroblast growth factor 1 (acidic), partial [Silurus meridionalis]